jgi:hypothetical protein
MYRSFNLFNLSYRLTTNSPWCPGRTDPEPDDLLQSMNGLNLIDNAPAKGSTLAPSINLDVELDSEDSTVTTSRPSIDYHASSLDLTSQLHGTTPVPRRLSKGRPPRMSMGGIIYTASKKAMYSASPAPISSSSRRTSVDCVQDDNLST